MNSHNLTHCTSHPTQGPLCIKKNLKENRKILHTHKITIKKENTEKWKSFLCYISLNTEKKTFSLQDTISVTLGFG